AAEAHSALVRVVRTDEQLGKRRLAGTGRAYEREVLSGLDGKRDVAEHPVARRVGEGDVVGDERATPRRLDRVGPLRHVDRRLDQADDLRERRAAGLELGEPVAEARDRLE